MKRAVVLLMSMAAAGLTSGTKDKARFPFALTEPGTGDLTYGRSRWNIGCDMIQAANRDLWSWNDEILR